MADALPDNGQIVDDLLKVLHLRTRPVSASEMYDLLAERNQLSSFGLGLKTSTEGRSLWENRVRTAREHMAKKGLLHRDPHNQWQLTKEGHRWAWLRTKPGGASLEDLGL